MAKSRKANIVFKIIKARKGEDSMPVRGASCGTMDNGPLSKNLLMPKEEVNTLKTKDISGRACENWLK